MILVFFLGILLIFYAGSLWYARVWHINLVTEVRFCEPYLYAGETGTLEEVIENRKKIPVPSLEISFRIPHGLRFQGVDNTQDSDYIYKRDVFALLGQERIIRRCRILAERRGQYEISQLTQNAPSLFYGREYLRSPERKGASGIYVYARNLVYPALLREVEVLLGTRECTRRLYEDPFAFSSIREYTPRDPMKNINWKATARTGTLCVNTFQSDQADRIAIYLDVTADFTKTYADLREDSIALAATLLRRLAGRGLEVSLAVNAGETGTFFFPFRDERTATRIERFLTTDFDRVHLIPFPDLLREAKTSSLRKRDEIALIVSANDSPDLREAARALLGKSQGIFALPCLDSDRRVKEQDGPLSLVPVIHL